MIFIRKGDDTDFNNSSFLKFELITESDLTGWTALFTINSIKREITDISSKTFEINLSKEETEKFDCGKTTNEVKLTDQNGRVKTVIKDLDIVVTTDVVNNPHQTINVPILKEDGIDINIKVSNVEGVGTTNHNELENRNIPNQHTISAITNLQEELDAKQSLISDLNEIRANSTNALKEHQDISHLATKKELEAKQDVISDLEEIRENATNALKEHQDITYLATKEELNAKQDVLVSGTNIKTINNQSILGEGDIEIKAASESTYTKKDINLLNQAQLEVTTSAVATEYDLSDYLPDDDNDYEILVNMEASSGTTVGSYLSFFLISSICSYVNIAKTTCSTTGTAGATSSTCWFPIGTDRKLRTEHTVTKSKTLNIYLRLRGYKKL